MEQQDHLESRIKIRLLLWGAFMVYLTYRLLNNLDEWYFTAPIIVIVIWRFVKDYRDGKSLTVEEDEK